MKRVGIAVLLIAFVAFLEVGCAYKYRFKTGNEPAVDKKVKEWRHIYGWGYGEPKALNLEEACPEGVAEFGSYVSFTNWLCAFCTLGIYSPRTVYAIPVASAGGGAK
jgi:hypothetical protein